MARNLIDRLALGETGAALTGLVRFVFRYPGQRSFHFACPGILSFGLSTLSIWAFSRRLLRVGFEQSVNFLADFFAHSD
jgi:hypothetical protein